MTQQGLFQHHGAQTGNVFKPTAPRGSGTWPRLMEQMQHRVRVMLTNYHGRIFKTDAGDVAGTFLASFPESDRQYHNCRCCLEFLRRYGDLAVLTDVMTLEPLLWAEDATKGVPSYYRRSVEWMRAAVERARIVEPFFIEPAEWGVKRSGGFDHFHVEIDHKYRWTRRDITAEQRTAQLKEDFRTLQHAQNVTKPITLDLAIDMLRAGRLERAEKLLPMAEFLKAAQGLSGRGETRVRQLWAMVVTAPAGFCSPRSSALGALLEDIVAGHTAGVIQQRHNSRVAPDKYQRAQAPASDGNIAQAEKLFERLGLQSALRRRTALSSELVRAWVPVPQKGHSSSLFGHLRSDARGKAERQLTSGAPQRVTWSSFRKRQLEGGVQAMEVRVPARGQFTAMTTQADPGARPLMLWDSEECRNPFAWYTYVDGSMAHNWGLLPGSWATVDCVSLLPHMWQGEDRFAHLPAGALFVLSGAADRHNSFVGLFPELIRGDLHSVRSTIEAYSRSAKREQCPPGQQAAGLMITSAGTGELEVRVRTANGFASYIIDRWE